MLKNMARYCIYCGKPVKEEDEFCTHCGKSTFSKIPQAEKKIQDVIPEIPHEKIFEKAEEIKEEKMTKKFGSSKEKLGKFTAKVKEKAGESKKKIIEKLEERKERKEKEGVEGEEISGERKVMDLFEQMRKARKWRDRLHIAEKILDTTYRGAEHLVEPTIQALQKEKSYIVADRTRDILVKIGTDSAVEGIKQTAYGKAGIINDFVVLELEKVKTPAAYQAIKEILFTHNNKIIRNKAIDAIYRSKDWLGEEFAVDTFIKALKIEIDLELGKKLLKTLHWSSVRICTEKITDALIDMSKNHENQEIREEAEEISKKIIGRIQIGARRFEIDGGRMHISGIREGDLPNADWGDKASTVKGLRISSNKIKSLNGVEALTELTRLRATATSLEDLRAIAYLPNLEELELYNNRIYNLEGLANHSNLKLLSLRGNKIEKIHGLTNLPKLTSLDLSGNKITEISGLNDLVNLENLDLGDNQITKVKGLQNLKYLSKINLKGNPIPTNIRTEEDQILAARCVGVPLDTNIGKRYELNPLKPNIRPFVRAILQKNVEDRCFYCKNSVPSGQNHQADCEEKLRNIIFSKNSKIPVYIKETRQTTPSPTSRTGYEINQGRLKPITIYSWSPRGKTEGVRKYTANFDGKVLSSLAGTLCMDCAAEFLKSVKKVFREVKTRGSANSIILSVNMAVGRHESLIDRWVEKAS